ncbi:MAG: 4-(cytidine 5'-diphospho)-2-C-methyl-D-erythritol kinase [Pseudomonadota bacterium]
MTPEVSTVSAPAKLNLFLWVEGRRPDGYHLLSTWMVKIDLADKLTLDFGGEGLRLEVKPAILPTDGENLVYRAAESFFRAADLEPRVGIVLEKQIPTAAGLGGGSSDAAAVLTALNRAHGRPLGPVRLAELGLALGADIPFFLQPCNSALAQGIGEVLRDGPDVCGRDVVVVNPGWALSTAWVFKNFNLELTSGRHNHIFSRLNESSFTIDGTLTNDLESVVLPRFQEVGLMKSLLAEAGAEVALMTGSGPSVFGIFNNRMEAFQARDFLRERGRDNWKVFQARTM